MFMLLGKCVTYDSIVCRCLGGRARSPCPGVGETLPLPSGRRASSRAARTSEARPVEAERLAYFLSPLHVDCPAAGDHGEIRDQVARRPGTCRADGLEHVLNVSPTRPQGRASSDRELTANDRRHRLLCAARPG
jgi:hypothetical protein